MKLVKFFSLCPVIIVIMVSIFTSCGINKNAADQDRNGNNSGLSEISLGLPTLDKFPEAGRKLLTGYQLIIEPTKDCTGAKVLERIDAWSSAKLQEKLVRGCEYSIGLQLGNLSQDGKSLAAIYFTNWAGAKKGYVMTTTEPKMDIRISLRMTEEGEKAGLGKTGTEIVTPGETDLSIQVDVGGNTTVIAGYSCLIQNNNLTISAEKNEQACNDFVTSKENEYKNYLEAGDYKIDDSARGNLLERSARLVYFAVNKERAKRRSNLSIMEYYRQNIDSNTSLFKDAEVILSKTNEESGVRRDVSNIVPYPKAGEMKENERALFDTADERRTFSEGTPLAGTYSEEELYDLLKRTSNISYVPKNGIIISVQDMVDGKSWHTLNSSERDQYEPFQDSYFYLYREGGKKKVIEVLGNLRHGSGDSGPYYSISEFGIFQTIADVHIYDSSGVSVAALRGHRSWDFNSNGNISTTGRKSFNFHPGGYSSRGSAGCATVRNRSQNGKSNDYLVLMTEIQSFAFHSDEVLGDQYDPNSSDVKARAALNGVFLRKIIVYD